MDNEILVLETSPVHFSYDTVGDSTPILDTGSIRMQKGTVYSLHGANMSGKTTLIRVLSGHLHPSNFWLSINGRSLDAFDPISIREAGISCCHQNDPMFPDLSIWDNVRLGAIARNQPASTAKLLLDEHILTQANEGSLLPSSPMRVLSGGFRTVLRLLRTVAWGFNIVLLDEPTVGLDPRMKARFFSVLFQALQPTKSALFISHVEHEHRLLERNTLDAGLNYQAWDIKSGKIGRVG